MSKAADRPVRLQAPTVAKLKTAKGKTAVGRGKVSKQVHEQTAAEIVTRAVTKGSPKKKSR